jgi:predicted nucleotidyltransferase
MGSIVQSLIKKGFMVCPKFVEDNVIFEAVTGSYSYGIESNNSDTDVVAVVMNPKSDLFPNQAGYIYGFGPPYQAFTTFQQHKIPDSGVEYDVALYGIANYFTLASAGNPNIIDLLFSPQFCIRHNTLVGQHIRANRKLFLHKGFKHKFIGYAYAQLKKIDNKDKEGKRADIISRYGFDTKYSAHLVRLCLECEQILQEGDLDLTKNSAVLKAIRNGEWTEEQVRAFFNDKEKYLEKLYQESSLPHSPDMDKIKALLVECIEMHYGSLDKVLHIESYNDNILRQVRELINKAQL